MKKTYIKPNVEVIVAEVNNLMNCSICDHPGNHYGHHKNWDDDEE